MHYGSWLTYVAVIDIVRVTHSVMDILSLRGCYFLQGLPSCPYLCFLCCHLQYVLKLVYIDIAPLLCMLHYHTGQIWPDMVLLLHYE